MLAVRNSNVNMVTKLMDSGAKVDIQDKKGWWRVYRGNVTMNVISFKLVILLSTVRWRVLIATVLYCNNVTFTGYTALMLAVRNGQTGLVTQFVDAGANINQQDETG